MKRTGAADAYGTRKQGNVNYSLPFQKSQLAIACR